MRLWKPSWCVFQLPGSHPLSSISISEMAYPGAAFPSCQCTSKPAASHAKSPHGAFRPPSAQLQGGVSPPPACAGSPGPCPVSTEPGIRKGRSGICPHRRNSQTRSRFHVRASVPLRCRFGAAAWARHICAETSIEQCPQRSATSWRPFQRRRRQCGISVASCHMRMGGGAQLEAVMERLVAENMLLARKLAIAEAELRDLQPPPPPLDTPGCAGRRRLCAILQGTRGVLGGA